MRAGNLHHPTAGVCYLYPAHHIPRYSSPASLAQVLTPTPRLGGATYAARSMPAGQEPIPRPRVGYAAGRPSSQFQVTSAPAAYRRGRFLRR
jgi:hypothetical protein